MNSRQHFREFRNEIHTICKRQKHVVRLPIHCHRILGFIYYSALETDYEICKARVARDLGISPTTSIYKALHNKINSVTHPGMTLSQVHDALETLYPIIKLDEQTKLEGKSGVYVALDTCWFNRNNWKFLFIYSKEGKLEDFINYIDD